MDKNLSLVWKLGVAIVSLVAAVAVYSSARIHPPELLAPIQALNADLTAHQNLFGNAPSVFYTLALGLLIGVCASTRAGARFHCLIWIGLALILELSQYPTIAEPVSGWIGTNFPDSTWALIGPYWTRGVFDPLDLLATLLGGGIALYLLTHLPLEKGNVHD